MNKNEQYEVIIDDVGANGEGICHLDGTTIFVPFAFLNEKCKIHILRVKDSIAYAKVVELLEESAERIQTKCPYFEKCGGCTLQHITMNAELGVKRQHIQTCFKKYAGVNGLEVSMVDSNLNYGYRNKCAFPVRNVDGVPRVCMFRANSHSAIAIAGCPLANDLINKVVDEFNGWLVEYKVSAFDEETSTGLVKFLVCRVLDGKVLITIVINGTKLANIDAFAQKLKEQNIDFGLNLNINTKNNNVILSDKFTHICGFETLQGVESGVLYPVSSLSFMQVNDYVKTAIYNTALESVSKGSIVIDAYSGAGLMSAMLAAKAKHVYGVEIVPDATKNADALAAANGIKNMTNINGDCAAVLPQLVKRLKNETIQVVLDPPRKGCDKRVLEAVIVSGPSKIVYISCNPATLARDAKHLLDAGYNIHNVTGFNMFPQTSHVETVVIFEKGSQNEN